MNLRATTARSTAQSFLLQFEGHSISYQVTRSKRRRKTISISVTAPSGVRVAAPVATSDTFIHELVAKRADWILKRLAAEANVPPPRDFLSGETIPYLGQDVPLHVNSTDLRRVKLELVGDRFVLAVPSQLEGESRELAIRAAATRWYRLAAESALTRSVNHWSRLMNLRPRAVLVRDQRRRWGSCGPDGTLRFNWRLILAEPAILDYVVVHELAHLAQRNHSPKFWAVVEQFLPDFRARRKSLRETGSRLTM